MMRHAIRLLALLLIFAATPAVAEEVILSYDVAVTVEASGDLVVTERIAVTAEGNRIRRGIFRDFPTIYRLGDGTVRTTTFEVQQVTRDDQAEPWHQEGIEGGQRLYIGDEDTYLSPGDYLYEITYRTARQMRFFASDDELYWNVTGNFWEFPILRATAAITLPQGARISRQAGYTGARGETGRDYRVTSRDGSFIAFATTRRLEAREGFTVAAAFQKGLVTEPGATAIQGRYLWDNLGIFILLAGVPLMAVFYLVAWRRHGIDPPRGLVIPLFEPPLALPPADISYIFYRGLGESVGRVPRAFVAALMNLASLGRIRIDEADRVLTLHLLQSATHDLPPGEKTIVEGFFGTSAVLTIDKPNRAIIESTLTFFRKAIEGPNKERWFTTNAPIVFTGLVFSFLFLLSAFVLFPIGAVQAVQIIVAVVGGVFSLPLLVGGWRRLIGDVPGGSVWAGVLMIIIGLVIATLLLGGEVFLTWAQLVDAQGDILPWATLGMVASAYGLVALFMVGRFLLFRPTVEGRKLMDEIEGFRLYLSVAEADRLNMAGAPDFTVQLFERFLPHAIALKVEKPWSEALEAHLNRIGGSTGDYSPRFYTGSSWNSAHIGAATAGIASTLGAGFASAMPSSSGSGGGGSSGGGGGGGGGGGW